MGEQALPLNRSFSSKISSTFNTDGHQNQPSGWTNIYNIWDSVIPWQKNVSHHWLTARAGRKEACYPWRDLGGDGIVLHTHGSVLNSVIKLHCASSLSLLYRLNLKEKCVWGEPSGIWHSKWRMTSSFRSCMCVVCLCMHAYMFACVTAGICASHTYEGQKTTSGGGPWLLPCFETESSLFSVHIKLSRPQRFWGILPSLPLHLLQLHWSARIPAKYLCAFMCLALPRFWGSKLNSLCLCNVMVTFNLTWPDISQAERLSAGLSALDWPVRMSVGNWLLFPELGSPAYCEQHCFSGRGSWAV